MTIPSTYITVPWPEGPIRIPPLQVGPVEVSKDFLFLDSNPLHEATLPDGAYLHELVDLDLDSPTAIATFVKTSGYPTGEAQGLGPRWADLQRLWGPRPEDVPRDLPQLPDDSVDQHRSQRGEVAYSIVEFVERANLVKNMTQIQLYRRSKQTLAEVAMNWWSGTIQPPTSEAHALYALVVVMNWGLSTLQPFLGVAVPEGSEPWPRFEDALTLRRPGLFEALYVQLYNDVAANADYRRCDNSTCEHWFKRTAPGKRFCNNKCARLETQRQFNRRGTRHWTETAASFAREVRAAEPALNPQEMYERFQKVRPDQPYNDLDQFKKACKAATDRADGGGAGRK